MSFGETTSTEWGLLSRALSWLPWHQSPPLLLLNQPTATHRLAGGILQRENCPEYSLLNYARPMDEVEDGGGDQEDEFLSEQQEVLELPSFK